MVLEGSNESAQSQDAADQEEKSSVAPSTSKLIIIEDHVLFSHLVTEALRSETSLEVVATCTTGAKGIEATERYKPDVIVLDVNLPDCHGGEILERLLELSPDSRVLVVSAFLDRDQAYAMLKRGATGLVAKTASVEELKDAVKTVAAGEPYFCAETKVALGPEFLSGDTSAIVGTALLTPREMEVLRSVGLGHTTKEIATQYGLSVKTVESHRASIMRKLRLRNAASMTRRAIQLGLVPLN